MSATAIPVLDKSFFLVGFIASSLRSTTGSIAVHP
jgi:hypothetical protein